MSINFNQKGFGELTFSAAKKAKETKQPAKTVENNELKKISGDAKTLSTTSTKAGEVHKLDIGADYNFDLKTSEEVATKLPDLKSLQNDQARLMDMLARAEQSGDQEAMDKLAKALDANAGAMEIIKNEKLSASERQMQFSEIARDVDELFDDDGRAGRTRGGEAPLYARDRRRRMHDGDCGITWSVRDFQENSYGEPAETIAFGSFGHMIGQALGWFDHDAHCRGCGGGGRTDGDRGNETHGPQCRTNHPDHPTHCGDCSRGH